MNYSPAALDLLVEACVRADRFERAERLIDLRDVLTMKPGDFADHIRRLTAARK